MMPQFSLEKILELMPGAVLTVSVDGVIIYANQHAHQMFGYAPGTLNNVAVERLIPPEFRARHQANVAAFFAKKADTSMRSGKEFLILRANGSIAPANIEISPVEDGETRLALVSLVDISQYKQQQIALRRANRALRFLSACNRLLLHASDEMKFLEEVCQTALDEGGYILAWVGRAENDAQRRVTPIAQAGDAQRYLQEISITWNDDIQGRGPTGTSIRENRTVVARNILTDPTFEPWRKQALARGYQSSISIPLHVDGQMFGALMMYAPEPEAFDAREQTFLVEVAADVAFGIEVLRARAEHRVASSKVARLAYFDTLTGLPNRIQLLEQLDADLASGRRGVLLAVDLVHFKDINDTYGYLVGDALLAYAAQRLQAHVREGDVLARIGGDEFMFKRNDCGADAAAHWAGEIAESFVEPLRFEDHEYQLGVRIGIEKFPAFGIAAHSLIAHAGLASRASASTQRDIKFYSTEMDERIVRRVEMVRDIKKAIDNGEMSLHFQPKVALDSGRLTGAEALLRWRHPLLGDIRPDEFISVAEDSGMMPHLGQWVTREACRRLMQWKAQRLHFPGRLAVNVSARQFEDANFIAKLHDVFSECPGVCSMLELEITESVFASDLHAVVKVLDAVSKLGVTIAIDDFGTKFSSLSYLTRLPVHGLKIDIAFVRNMFAGKRDQALINIIVGIANNLGFVTTAEGVETQRQADVLRALGCKDAQGFLYGRAVPAEEFAQKWLVPATKP